MSMIRMDMLEGSCCKDPMLINVNRIATVEWREGSLSMTVDGVTHFFMFDSQDSAEKAMHRIQSIASKD